MDNALVVPILGISKDVLQSLCPLVGSGRLVVLYVGFSELKQIKSGTDLYGRIPPPRTVFVPISNGLITVSDALSNLVFIPVGETL